MVTGLIFLAGCQGPRYTDPYSGEYQAHANMSDRGFVSSTISLLNDGVQIGRAEPSTNDSFNHQALQTLSRACASSGTTGVIDRVLDTIAKQFPQSSHRAPNPDYPLIAINGDEFFAGDSTQMNPKVFARLDIIAEALHKQDGIKTTLIVNSPQTMDTNVNRARRIEHVLETRGIDPKLTDAYGEPNQHTSAPWPHSVTWMFCTVK